jgi:hypothetical protein
VKLNVNQNKPIKNLATHWLGIKNMDRITNNGKV